MPAPAGGRGAPAGPAGGAAAGGAPARLGAGAPGRGGPVIGPPVGAPGIGGRCGCGGCMGGRVPPGAATLAPGTMGPAGRGAPTGAPGPAGAGAGAAGRGAPIVGGCCWTGGGTGAAGRAGVGCWRAGEPAATGTGAGLLEAIGITPPQTAQRARTPPGGTRLGSTRKIERHSGHATFIGPLQPQAWSIAGFLRLRPQADRADGPRTTRSPGASWRSSSSRSPAHSPDRRA